MDVPFSLRSYFYQGDVVIVVSFYFFFWGDMTFVLQPKQVRLHIRHHNISLAIHAQASASANA